MTELIFCAVSVIIVIFLMYTALTQLSERNGDIVVIISFVLFIVCLGCLKTVNSSIVINTFKKEEYKSNLFDASFAGVPSVLADGSIDFTYVDATTGKVNKMTQSINSYDVYYDGELSTYSTENNIVYYDTGAPDNETTDTINKNNTEGVTFIEKGNFFLHRYELHFDNFSSLRAYLQEVN